VAECTADPGEPPSDPRGGAQQSVLRRVHAEVVEADVHGQRQPKAVAQLLRVEHAPAHNGGRLLYSAISLQDPLLERPRRFALEDLDDGK